ncbi:MAG TPA: ABC transporter permease, partial [Gemmatimonadales bacterium]|nr:ABC transporter permease [Gemmatimonadales bacterium]
SLAERVVFRPIPYPDADRLVALWQVNPAGRWRMVSLPNYQDWKRHARSFDVMAAFTNPPATVLGGVEPARTRVQAVSAGYFRLLGARPALGRLLAPDDHAGRGTDAAVVSHAFWQRYLAGDSTLANAVLTADGHSLRVVGVLTAAFRAPSEGDVWMPLDESAESARAGGSLNVIARLRTGVTVDAARAEMERIAADIWRSHGSVAGAASVKVSRLDAEMVGTLRGSVLGVLVASGILLLVAIGNAAVFIRGPGGASGRSARCLLLGFLAVVGGVPVASVLVHALVRLNAEAVPAARLFVHDGSVVLPTLATTGLALLLLATAPVVQRGAEHLLGVRRLARPEVTDAAPLAWRVTVGTQCALAVLLMAGAGMLARSAVRLAGAELGFDPHGTVVAQLVLPRSSYPSSPDLLRYRHRLLEALASTPGARAVGLVSFVPLSGRDQLTAVSADAPASGPRPGREAAIRSASSGYFEAMDIPVVRGRSFAEGLRGGDGRSAVVNAALAREHWGDADPLGRRLYLSDGTPLTVIGIVGDVRHNGPLWRVVPEVYVDHRDYPDRDFAAVVRFGSADTPPAALGSAVRRLDPEIPVEVARMDQLVGRVASERNLAAGLTMGLGLLALALAAAGIYCAVALALAQLRREARWQPSARSIWTPPRKVMEGALAGVAAGLLAAVGAGPELARMLVDTHGADVPVALAGAALVAIVAATASHLPAWRLHVQRRGQ